MTNYLSLSMQIQSFGLKFALEYQKNEKKNKVL